MIVYKTQNATKKFKGIKLPLSKFNGGVFEKSITTKDQAFTNLINLLLTRRGERIMHPNFGTSIMKIIFEQNTEYIVEYLKTDISNAISYWLPTINVLQLDIDPTDEFGRDRGHLLTITIKVVVEEGDTFQTIKLYPLETGNIEIEIVE